MFSTAHRWCIVRTVARRNPVHHAVVPDELDWHADLNSVALGTSPAITLGAEHPAGAQYAEYLFRLAKFFELPICANTDVQSVQKVDDEFHIEVAEGTVRAKHLIWAAGEFRYPRLDGVAGAQRAFMQLPSSATTTLRATNSSSSVVTRVESTLRTT